MKKHKYTVYIDDNFHFMDKSYRVKYAEYNTIKEAIKTCQVITKLSLLDFFKAEMSHEELVLRYQMFGDDPWIDNTNGVIFSAWDYVKEKAKILTN